jgi:hypothetical protein
VIRAPRNTGTKSSVAKTAGNAIAENEEWMAVHIDKTTQRRKNYDNRTALSQWKNFLVERARDN